MQNEILFTFIEIYIELKKVQCVYVGKSDNLFDSDLNHEDTWPVSDSSPYYCHSSPQARICKTYMPQPCKQIYCILFPKSSRFLHELIAVICFLPMCLTICSVSLSLVSDIQLGDMHRGIKVKKRLIGNFYFFTSTGRFMSSHCDDLIIGNWFHQSKINQSQFGKIQPSSRYDTMT